MSRVWLRPPNQGEMLELRLKDRSRPSVTLWEWRAAGKRLRAVGKHEVNEEAQFKAVEASRQLVTDAEARTTRPQAQPIRDARRAVGLNGEHPAEGPKVDYSKPPRVYEVEEW
jgi:putative transposase